MPLLVECTCGKKLKVRDELAGKKVKCPGCGGIVTAPAPEPELVEPIDDEPVTAVAPQTERRTSKGNGDTYSTDVSAEPPPIPRKKPRPAELDDEDEDAKKEEGAPHWVFPGAFSSEIMALGREGIWFVSLKGEALDKATDLLKNGNPSFLVLGEKSYYLPWPEIGSITCNRKLNGFTITYTHESETTSKVMTPADMEARDDIMDAIKDFLHPDVTKTVKKHTAITAMVAPIICICVTFAITLGIAILTLFLSGDWEGRGRGALVAALFNLLAWLGPLGTCGIGGLIGAFMVVWMVVRMADPPIEVTLKPTAPKLEDE